MKKIQLLLVIMLLSVVLFAQVTHVTDFNAKDFDFSKSVTVSVNNNNYTKFELPTYPTNAVPGNPELPVKYVRLVIPSGQVVERRNKKIRIKQFNNIAINKSQFF